MAGPAQRFMPCRGRFLIPPPAIFSEPAVAVSRPVASSEKKWHLGAGGGLSPCAAPVSRSGVLWLRRPLGLNPGQGVVIWSEAGPCADPAASAVRETSTIFTVGV